MASPAYGTLRMDLVAGDGLDGVLGGYPRDMVFKEAGMKIFIGWDDREAIAGDVCRASILNFQPKADVRFLKLTDPDVEEIFDRPYRIEHGQYIDDQTGALFSTQFSYSRFLVPALMEYNSWAIFVDCDFLFRADIERLFALADDKYAVMCVKHNHEVRLSKFHPGKLPKKMDGIAQQPYAMKNWSSLMLWNCGHQANKRLTPFMVSTMPGLALHTFFWLQKEEIGEIPEVWNWLVGMREENHQYHPKHISPTTVGGAMVKYPRKEVKAVHMSEGGPWFPKYKTIPFADEWESYILPGSPLNVRANT